MTPERWAQIEELFHRAVELDPEHRIGLLNQTCSDDPELRQQVEALLTCNGSAADSVQSAVRSEFENFRFPLTGTVVSHYRILGGLGGGGMGVVYRAEDIKLGRLVALKFLPEESASNPVALTRFEHEARSASALEHPNICPIYEFGEHAGRSFFAMPLLQGQTLRERLASSGPPNLEAVLDIAVRIANGLDAAHQKHIIHRDIKPANIFITTLGEVKILDFGIAKVLEQQTLPGCESEDNPGEQPRLARLTSGLHVTRTGVTLGTAGYMSPEQVRGEALDARTDIFSFGLVLYEMVAGRRAFAGETAHMLHNAILNEAPRPVRELNPDVPSALERIIAKALQKHPTSRYQSTAAISVELKAQFEALRRKDMPGHSRYGRWAVAVVAALTLAAVLFLWTRSYRSEEVSEFSQKQLTNNSSESPVSGGSISPDGRYLAYADLKGIHVKSIETGETRNVPQPGSLKELQVNWGIATNWVSDGSRFIANANVAGKPSSIWAVPAKGGSPRKLRDDAYAWAVSRDGSWLAFTSNPGRTFYREMWRMTPDGEQPSRLFLGDDNNGFFGADWSPDGRRLSYFGARRSGQNLKQDIETHDFVGGPAILAEVGEVADWTWSPDGRLIYILPENGDFSGSCNFWAKHVDAQTGKPKGNPKRLTDWAGFCMEDPSVTADGKQLAFRKLSAQSTVYIADLTDAGTSISKLRRLTLYEGRDYPAAWTPDSKAVVFRSYRDGQWKILRQYLNEDASEQIATGAEDEGGPSATISPNGDSVFYLAPSKDPSGSSPEALMRVPISGGHPEALLTGHFYGKPACARAPASVCVMAEQSPNHKQLIFTEFDPANGRGNEIRRFDTDSTPGTRYFWDLSPDGTKIALLRGSTSTIYILPLRDLAERRTLVRGWSSLLSVNWSSDGSGIFSSSQTEKASVLLRVDLNGNASVLWEQNGSVAPWNRPFAGEMSPLWAIESPDGRHIAIYSWSMSANMWMMKNF